MLESLYWIAGIIVAVVAIIGLFLRSKSNNSSTNKQNAKVSGEHNSISQNASISQNENN